MGNRVFMPLDVREIEELRAETGFSVAQLNEFYRRFAELSGNRPQLSRDDLQRIPELRMNPLCDRILHSFFTGDVETISFSDYARRLAIFKRGHHDSLRDDKIRFLYNMIDLNGDGRITVSEISEFLAMLTGDNMPPEQINSIALRCMSEADEDNNHQIDFEEFKKTLRAVEIEQKMSLSALNS